MPRNLSKLDEIKNKTLKKALDVSDLIYSNELMENELVSDDSNSVLYDKVNNSDNKDVSSGIKNLLKSVTILNKDEKDIEKLKKEILGKMENNNGNNS